MLKSIGCKPPITLAAIACAAALAACGSANHSVAAASGGVSAAHMATALKFAACMRSHGVPNFPDPTATGGIQIQAGSGVDPQSPSFQSAQKSCFKLLPGGGPGAQHPTAQEVASTLKVSASACADTVFPAFPIRR